MEFRMKLKTRAFLKEKIRKFLETMTFNYIFFILFLSPTCSLLIHLIITNNQCLKCWCEICFFLLLPQHFWAIYSNQFCKQTNWNNNKILNTFTLHFFPLFLHLYHNLPSLLFPHTVILPLTLSLPDPHVVNFVWG